jgi:hypothetical protein
MQSRNAKLRGSQGEAREGRHPRGREKCLKIGINTYYITVGMQHGEKRSLGFRRSDLQEGFFVAGTWGFRVWGYGTTDPLDEVLKQDYFQAARGCCVQES